MKSYFRASGWTTAKRLKDPVWAVDPDTVGQYTGYEDNNGTKLFEGHIVRNANNGEVAYIVFAHGRWMLKRKPSDKYCWNSLTAWIAKGGCVHIGNIFDNPELLEVSDGAV